MGRGRSRSRAGRDDQKGSCRPSVAVRSSSAAVRATARPRGSASACPPGALGSGPGCSPIPVQSTNNETRRRSTSTIGRPPANPAPVRGPAGVPSRCRPRPRRARRRSRPAPRSRWRAGCCVMSRLVWNTRSAPGGWRGSGTAGPGRAGWGGIGGPGTRAENTPGLLPGGRAIGDRTDGVAEHTVDHRSSDVDQSGAVRPTDTTRSGVVPVSRKRSGFSPETYRTDAP